MNNDLFTALLDRIIVDISLQPRVGGLDTEHIANLQNWPENWSPLEVVQQDGKYLLIDGFHRLAAAQNIGMEEVPIHLVDYPQDGDLHALAFALNATHGRPLTLGDRRAFTERLLRKNPEWADREIGRRSGLSSNTVGSIRVELEHSAQIEQTHVRVGAGGYTYKVGTNDPKRLPGSMPEPEITEVVGDLVGRLFTSEERVQQRHITKYLQRLSVALEDQEALNGWETATDAAEALRLVLGEDRAKQLSDSLGYSCRSVLDVAIVLGYEDGDTNELDE